MDHTSKLCALELMWLGMKALIKDDPLLENELSKTSKTLRLGIDVIKRKLELSNKLGNFKFYVKYTLRYDFPSHKTISHGEYVYKTKIEEGSFVEDDIKTIINTRYPKIDKKYYFGKAEIINAETNKIIFTADEDDLPHLRTS